MLNSLYSTCLPHIVCNVCTSVTQQYINLLVHKYVSMYTYMYLNIFTLPHNTCICTHIDITLACTQQCHVVVYWSIKGALLNLEHVKITENTYLHLILYIFCVAELSHEKISDVYNLYGNKTYLKVYLDTKWEHFIITTTLIKLN